MQGSVPQSLIDIGRICAIYESVLTPLLRGLQARLDISGQQKRVISNRLTDVEVGRLNDMLKLRPCVVTSTRHNKADICLLATYNSPDCSFSFDELPRMLKFFTVPVDPGVKPEEIASFPAERRISTTPQWVSSNGAQQWIICHTLEVDVNILQNWHCGRYSLDAHQLERLTTLCDSLLAHWTAKSKKHAKLLNDCLNEIVTYGQRSTNEGQKIFSSKATMPVLPSNSSVNTYRSYRPRPSGFTSQSSVSLAKSRFNSTLSMSKFPAATSDRRSRRRRDKVDETLEDVTGRIVNLSV